MNDLIGKKFKRNKYGLSLWEDEIVELYYALHWVEPTNFKKIDVDKWKETFGENKKFGFKAIPMVKGKNSIGPFELDEIIIYP